MSNNPIASEQNHLSPLAQSFLERAFVLGILDTDHLKDIEMDRSQRDQALAQLVEADLLSPLKIAGQLRVGRTGRPPLTFALTAAGAALATETGTRRARAYEQTNAVNQAHDVCTLDIRLAALASGHRVETERNLVDKPHIVRPDNILASPDGSLILIETEGYADAGQRARIVEKVLHWTACAQALQEIRAVLKIRVLFNVKPGPALEETWEVWTQSIAAAQRSLGNRPSIQFWGKALPEFLAAPTWNSVEGFIRLDDPARVKDFGLSPEQEKALEAPLNAMDLLPPALRRQSIAYTDDIVRLRAHGRYFARHLHTEMPRFSPEFFDLVREVYGVAFAGEKSEQLTIPVAALMMLRVYVLHYPDLQQALATAYRKFKNTQSVLMALRQATRLVNTFLDFHGLRHDHPDCRIQVLPPDLDGERGSDFTVSVSLSLARSRDIEDHTNWEEFQYETKLALAWVLQQLIDYPQVLGIDQTSQDSTSGNSRKKKGE